MNAAKLIKLAPMLVMITVLAYAGYSINTSASDPDAGEPGVAKGVEAVVRDNVTAGSSIEDGPVGAVRDPFQVSLEPGGLKSQDGAVADFDRLAKIVQELKLDATFLQGREQMAIINGRVYSKGQHLVLDGDLTPLFVANVLPATVVLRGGDRDYVLGYPDQLTLSHGPVNSPATSMIAKPAAPSARSVSVPRRHRSRGSRAGNS